MPLKSDSQGFLVGDPVNLIDLAEQWKQVSADTRAIRSMVSRIASALAVKTAKELSNPGAGRQANKVRTGERTSEHRQNQKPATVKHLVEVVQPGKRLNPGSSVATKVTPEADVVSRDTPQAQTPAAEPRAQVPDSQKTKRQRTRQFDKSDTVEPKRDAKGRFVGKKKAEGDKDSASSEKAGKLLQGAAGKLAEVVKGAGEGVGESDAAVQAMQEIAQPLSRGFEILGFGRNSEENWLRRIFRSLTQFRKEETVYNKAQNKTLKEIAEKPQVLSSVKEAGAGIVSRAKEFGAGALAIGKSFAKRIPLLGALIEGGSSLLDIFRSETDETKTRAEKDQATGKAAGKGLGAVGGMFGGAKLGAMIGSALGPVGTAIGTIVGGAAGVFFGGSAGSIIGEQIGSFVGYLREADIPGKIMSVWTGFTDTIKDGWDSVMEKLSGVWNKTKETVGGAVDSANNWVKEKTGIDIVGSVKGAFSKDGAIGSKFVRPEGEDFRIGRKKTDPWQLGATSELYESGNRGAGAISSGKGDHGGVSYGMYQLSSSQGSVQKFIKDAGYAELFEGKKVGSKEFNETWKNLAKYDPTFAAEQRNFVKREYYDKAHEGLKAKGIDLSTRGRAVQDAVWSTAVQFGAGGASDMMQKALKGKNVAAMSDAEIVSALQDYKIANNSKLFKSSSWRVQMGTLNRARSEKEQLLALAQQDAVTTSPNVNQTVVAAAGADRSGQIVRTPKAPVAPATTVAARSVKENIRQQMRPSASSSQIQMARVEQPVGTLADKKPAVVNVQGEIGQDVKDRAIAHIVTGGIAV